MSLLKIIKPAIKAASNLYNKGYSLNKPFQQFYKNIPNPKNINTSITRIKGSENFVNTSKDRILYELLSPKSFDKFIKNVKRGYEAEMKIFDKIASGTNSEQEIFKMWKSHYRLNIGGSVDDLGLPKDKFSLFQKIYDKHGKKRALQYIKEDMFSPYVRALENPYLYNNYSKIVNNTIKNSNIRLDTIDSLGKYMPNRQNTARNMLTNFSDVGGTIRLNAGKMSNRGSFDTLIHEFKHAAQDDLGYHLFPSVVSGTRGVTSLPSSRGAQLIARRILGPGKKRFAFDDIDYMIGHQRTRGWGDKLHTWFARPSEQSAVLSEIRAGKGIDNILNLCNRAGFKAMHGVRQGSKKGKEIEKAIWGVAPASLLGLSGLEDKS